MHECVVEVMRSTNRQCMHPAASPKPAPAPTKSLTKAPTSAPSLTPATDLESKLQEVKNLVAKGLLTEDEAAIRRKKIITDE